MRNSVLQPARELEEKLLEIPDLVSSLANKEEGACQNWINWLVQLEGVFKKYNYSQCAEVAGYRALMLSESLLIEKIKRSQRRRQQIQIALSTVQPVQQLLSDKSNELHQKIEKVRMLLKQILVPAKDAGWIKYDKNVNFTVFIESLLDELRSHKQIGHEVGSAIALIGKYDVLRILAEEIEVC